MSLNNTSLHPIARTHQPCSCFVPNWVIGFMCGVLFSSFNLVFSSFNLDFSLLNLDAPALGKMPVAKTFGQFHKHASSRAALRFYWSVYVCSDNVVLAVLITSRRHAAPEFSFLERQISRPLPPQCCCYRCCHCMGHQVQRFAFDYRFRL